MGDRPKIEDGRGSLIEAMANATRITRSGSEVKFDGIGKRRFAAEFMQGNTEGHDYRPAAEEARMRRKKALSKLDGQRK